MVSDSNLHWHSATVDTRSNTRDDPPDDQMGQNECRTLQNSPDDDEAHGQPYHPSPTKDVTNEEIRYTAAQGAQAIGTGGDASDGR